MVVWTVTAQVESSGWTKPMPLERADLMNPSSGSPEEAGQNKPVLLRASVPESHTVYEVIARMELVGGVFSRTMVSTCAGFGTGTAEGVTSRNLVTEYDMCSCFLRPFHAHTSCQLPAPLCITIPPQGGCCAPAAFGGAR